MPQEARPLAGGSRRLRQAFGRAVLVASLWLIAWPFPALGNPLPACPAPGRVPNPAYGSLQGAPNFQWWPHPDLSAALDCPPMGSGRPELAVAVAGTFSGEGRLADVARRIGAISRMQGLEYWSTTGQRWTVLVSRAFALSAPDIGARRTDFSAEEVLSGRELYFAQDDTRSSGLNLYRLRTIHSAPDRMVFETTNLLPIRYGFVELFGAGQLAAVHFVERTDTGAWRYYGLSVVEKGIVEGHEGSYVNRLDAFYRFLAGAGPGAWPPLAP